MRQEYGAFFLFILVGAAAWWFQSNARAGLVASSPQPASAGDITPTIPLSNVETPPNGKGWFPYYLVSNYPNNRGGNDVVPSMVVGGMAEYYGPQEVLPQF